MKQNFLPFLFFGFFLIQGVSAQPAGCDSLVPIFNIDFTAATSDSTWISPSVSRNGNCCGTIPPDRCVLFVITVGSNTTALTFNMNCALPSGSIYYQVNCGTPMQYGDTTFISTPGVYYMTYCKPGNIACTYSITSIAPQTPNGISENESSNSLLTQDATGNHFLNLALSSLQTFTLNVFSADGKKISEKNYSIGAGQHKILLPTENLPQGIYFVRLKSAESSVTKKLIVSR